MRHYSAIKLTDAVELSKLTRDIRGKKIYEILEETRGESTFREAAEQTDPAWHSAYRSISHRCTFYRADRTSK